VDGRPVAGLSLYEVADALQGPATSKVTVSVDRNGEPVDVDITRRRYALVPVRAQLCAPAAGTAQKIEYIRLTTFNQLSGAKVREAVTSGLESGADAFVLDLRSNSGGLFPGALDIAKQFMRKATIVLIADSDGVRDVFETDDTAIAPDKPLTLLVDKGSASASEVLAGALRDNKRATILGDTETFGKGLIQTVVPLADGSAVSVTVARYQTPSGADINKVGISPDAPLPVVTEEKEKGSALPSEPSAFCAVVANDEGVAKALFPR
jgi:C-terminal peptidase prc